MNRKKHFPQLAVYPFSAQSAPDANTIHVVEQHPPSGLVRTGWRTWWRVVMLLVSGILIFAGQPLRAQEIDGAAVRQATMSDALQREFAATDEPVTFLVILRKQLDANQVLAAADVQAAERTVRAVTLYNILTEHAVQTQQGLTAWLDQRGVAYRPYYIVNMLAVTGDAELADELLQRSEVDRLEANPQVASLNAVESALPRGWSMAPAEESAVSATLPWGLDYTHAPEVWALGYRGQGIVIASQDTGVKWDHPALQAAYRGWITDTMTVTHTYNWFDAWGVDTPRKTRCTGDAKTDAQIPCDDQGHGTHTVGTMLGDATEISDTVIGMAPDATWIGCRNMTSGFGTPASYMACFEFFLAPYPQGGNPMTDGKPELAPHIVNNSWGCPPSEGCDITSLRQIVETVRAAGIFVVASAGNYGNNCGSVRDPISIHDATFTIGAHANSGNIASFSSIGPVTIDGSNRRKPDIAAPGVDVRSAGLAGGVNTFLQGTSMASPHVAGAVALLWSAVPTLTGNIDLTEQVLIKSATPATSTQPCGVLGAGAWPNNIFGFGRLDALAAVTLAQHPATVHATIKLESGAPLPNAQVQLRDNATDYFLSGTSDENGVVVFSPVYASDSSDRYTLNVAASPELFAPMIVDVAVGGTTTLLVRPNQLTFLPLVITAE